MPSKGLGLRAGVAIPATAFVPQPESGLVAEVSEWLYWGSPPKHTEAPYSWLSFPATWQAETLANTATVTQDDGVSATRADTASVNQRGQLDAPPVTLHTTCDADPANLAQWTVTYRSPLRMKQPEMALVDLASRTPAERARILRVRQGARVVVTGAPATWPEGSHSLLVEGVRHTGRSHSRVVVWRTSAVAGTTPGTPGPWLRYGSSHWESTDVIGF
jgi:hypothetical protein